MVDSKNVERHLNEEKEDKQVVNEALQQIAYADRIILNKTDLVRSQWASHQQPVSLMLCCKPFADCSNLDVPAVYLHETFCFAYHT